MAIKQLNHTEFLNFSKKHFKTSVKTVKPGVRTYQSRSVKTTAESNPNFSVTLFGPTAANTMSWNTTLNPAGARKQYTVHTQKIGKEYVHTIYTGKDRDAFLKQKPSERNVKVEPKKVYKQNSKPVGERNKQQQSINSKLQKEAQTKAKEKLNEFEKTNYSSSLRKQTRRSKKLGKKHEEIRDLANKKELTASEIKKLQDFYETTTKLERKVREDSNAWTKYETIAKEKIAKLDSEVISAITKAGVDPLEIYTLAEYYNHEPQFKNIIKRVSGLSKKHKSDIKQALLSNDPSQLQQALIKIMEKGYEVDSLTAKQELKHNFAKWLPILLGLAILASAFSGNSNIVVTH